MNSAKIYSTKNELSKISQLLSTYMRLPLSTDTIPGAVMEGLLAHVRGGVVLKNYDFVDVVKKDTRCGWQVKSTKSNTPVTWKRAKIREQNKLINESRKSKWGLQALGNAIIEFCNTHVRESLEKHNLEQIGYSRLIIHDNGQVTYFERLLVTREHPELFAAADFEWKWSQAKKTKRKEQLQALHGIHKQSNKKWFAWHGLGENQLHFSGESNWWPVDEKAHAVTFKFPAPKDRIGFEKFIKLLSEAKN